MSEKPDNPSAFPWATGKGSYCDGMTLRDYFAAAALQGLLASPKDLKIDGEFATGRELAKLAYSAADAMLKAREP